MHAKTMVIGMLLMVFVAAGPLAAYANDLDSAQAVVDRARITFNEFMKDQNFTWMHEHMREAKGFLIFPEILKAGFIVGGSGGTGVLVTREGITCLWSDPAFYTIGSATFGLQIGGEKAEVLMMVMSQKAIDSLLASSVKLGGDTSVALGPLGKGAKANVTADFLSFARTKGLYAGLNLEGSVMHVREGYNHAYYGRNITPVDIIVKKNVENKGAEELISVLDRGICRS